jgi:predicted ribosome-associated RNA-binding protein Tma20
MMVNEAMTLLLTPILLTKKYARGTKADETIDLITITQNLLVFPIKGKSLPLVNAMMSFDTQKN